jgi:GNAT superfamily N-acetyltransferase
MEVQVRRAAVEDAAAIAVVHVRAWRVAYHGLMPDELLDGLSVTRRETNWREALTGEQGPEVLVAMHDGVVVGFCAAVFPSRDADAGEHVAEIEATYVDPDVWGAGVGRALMVVALAGLRAGESHAVTLWVLAENHHARDFYAQFGFEPDGAQTTDERSGQPEVRLHASLTP